MKLQQIVAQKHQSLEKEILFVRSADILSAMVRLPIVVMGLVLVALCAPIQQSLASSRTLILQFIRMAQLIFFMNWRLTH